MASLEIVQVIVVTVICFVFIAFRTTYRLTYRCTVHARCHRKWHADDIWMAFSILPLMGRALCIAWSNELITQSTHPDLSAVRQHDAKMSSNKLLIPGRIFYMFFLWSMKMCLLELYMRLSEGLQFYRHIGLGIRWSLYLTFVGVVLATVLECRPLELAWNGDPGGALCRKGRANLITMAVCNIVTDVALILFPISILRRSGLDFLRFIRLASLFALGSLVIITTIIRLPLILRDDAQKTRSLWASIEIACACFIANAPFFQAVIVDRRLSRTISHNTPLPSSTQSQISRTRTKSRARIRDDEDGDEIGLWHIEKRVSFHVEGRLNSSAGSGESGGSGLEEGREKGYGQEESRSTTVISLGQARIGNP